MRRAVLGFGIAVLAFVGFLFVFDPVAIWAELRGVSLAPFAAGLGAVLLAVACWAESMRRLHRTAGGDIPPFRGFVVYGTGMLAKQILPMGNASGVAIMAYVFDRESTLGFNGNLAVVTVGNFLGLAASLLLALVGAGYVLVTSPPTRLIQVALVGIGLLGALLVSVSALVLYRRAVLRYAALGAAQLLRRTLGRISARVESRLRPDDVGASLTRYFETIDRATADRRSLSVAAALALVGWTAFAVPFYTSAAAVGTPIPFGLVLFIVPAGGIAAILPLPGGIGGVEFAIAGATVALTAIEPATVAALVLLYRICVYWFLILLGMGCTAVTATGLGTLSAEVTERIEPGSRER